jgi:hypothetical protein
LRFQVRLNGCFGREQDGFRADGITRAIIFDRPLRRALVTGNRRNYSTGLGQDGGMSPAPSNICTTSTCTNRTNHTCAEEGTVDKRVSVKMPGIFKTPNPDAHTLSNNPPEAMKARVADFSYSNDALAQMIVDAWVLLDPAIAKKELAKRGIYLKNPVVIDEKDYDDGFASTTDEIVFVVPDKGRTDMAAGGLALLDTARLLMACTPHGI